MWHTPNQTSAPVPAILFIHGFTGNRVESFRVFVLTARRLAEQGIASLRIDCRGSGDSEGSFEEMSVRSEVRDAEQALTWIRNRQEVDVERVGLLGFSMGGLVCALVLGNDPEIRAAALWSPVGRPRTQIEKRSYPGWESDFSRLGFVTTEGWKLGPQFIEEMNRLDPLAAIRSSRAPLLLVHGDRDESVDVQSTHDYERVLLDCGVRVVKQIMEGADHTYAAVAWQEQLQSFTTDWFVRELI